MEQNEELNLGRTGKFNKEKWLPLTQELPAKISHKCCDRTKKHPMHKYQHKVKQWPIVGTMASESRLRRQGWMKTGCNAYESRDPKSQPMSFWRENDVLRYILNEDLPIASVYGEIIGLNARGKQCPTSRMTCKLKTTGCERTGCLFCPFGCQNEKGESRFERLAKTHPKHYAFAVGGGQWVDNPDYDPVAPEYDGAWKNWNPKKIWVPSKKGLGLGKIFDMANEIYGEQIFRY